MSKSIETLIEAYSNPHVIHKKNQRGDKPIIGYLTEHVPVEILHAAGTCPVRIQGGTNVDLAALHMQSFSCSYARGAIHQAEHGDYDYLEGLVSAKTCDVGLSLFQIWTDFKPLKFNYLLSLPGNCDEDAQAYFQNELLRFRSHLEAYREKKFSNEIISESIALYNAIRENIEELWSRRNSGQLAMEGGQFIRALKGTQVMPPEVTLGLLNDLKQEMHEESKSSPDGVRLLLLGNSYGDISLVDLIERCGGNIVFDDTAGMGRLFGAPVAVSRTPIEDLAEHYLCRVTGSFRLTYEDRWNRILQMIKQWKIDACINVIQKFCDTWLFERPLMEASMKEMGIPLLNLDIDDSSVVLGQLETRVQAFIEIASKMIRKQ